MGAHEPAIAFATRAIEPPALEIRVNFGMFAGREATSAEIDDLATQLLDKVTEVAIVAEYRHEISAHSEAALHQVRIEVSGDDLPDEEHELDELRGSRASRRDRRGLSLSSTSHWPGRTVVSCRSARSHSSPQQFSSWPAAEEIPSRARTFPRAAIKSSSTRPTSRPRSTTRTGR